MGFSRSDTTSIPLFLHFSAQPIPRSRLHPRRKNEFVSIPSPSKSTNLKIKTSCEECKTTKDSSAWNSQSVDTFLTLIAQALNVGPSIGLNFISTTRCLRFHTKQGTAFAIGPTSAAKSFVEEYFSPVELAQNSERRAWSARSSQLSEKLI